MREKSDREAEGRRRKEHKYINTLAHRCYANAICTFNQQQQMTSFYDTYHTRHRWSGRRRAMSEYEEVWCKREGKINQPTDPYCPVTPSYTHTPPGSINLHYTTLRYKERRPSLRKQPKR